ncbi:MAG TPA: hypothetical protein VEJ63_03505 [Planctomycetota bacterium]|nr:hypothetical protein [Planctomycetota bacterium]
MKSIDEIEKHLPPKRKVLLHALRKHNWEVIGVDDSALNWALDMKWTIQSTLKWSIQSNRENKGATLILWFFKHDGMHDGVDRVAVTTRDAPQPSTYGGGGEPELYFDGRRFEVQLQTLIASLHTYRVSGTLAVTKAKRKGKS